jgi:hypothetical protein
MTTGTELGSRVGWICSVLLMLDKEDPAWQSAHTLGIHMRLMRLFHGHNAIGEPATT